MSRKTIYLDRAKLSGQISRFQSETDEVIAGAKSQLKEIVVTTALEVAYQAADRTFPRGYGFKLAKGMMAHDVKKLYATGSRVFETLKNAGEIDLARLFYRAYKTGDLSTAEGYLRLSRTFYSSVPVGRLDPSLHDRSRNPKDGHVSVSHPLQVVPQSDFNEYQNIAIQRLGKTASGWMACAEQLGGNGNLIRWKGTAVHGSDGGEVTENDGDLSYVVEIHNRRPLAFKLLSASQIQRIKEFARRRLLQRLRTAGLARKGSLR